MLKSYPPILSGFGEGNFYSANLDQSHSPQAIYLIVIYRGRFPHRGLQTLLEIFKDGAPTKSNRQSYDHNMMAHSSFVGGI